MLALFAVPVISIAIALGIHALGVSLGWSFLIVGGGYLVLGGIAAFIGIKMLARAKPSNRAADSVKADLHAIVRKPAVPVTAPAARLPALKIARHHLPQPVARWAGCPYRTPPW